MLRLIRVRLTNGLHQRTNGAINRGKVGIH